ncbi:MAG: di-trans,poly-cis-decaprenylcistransferase [Phycisphaerales bacterium]|nr:di-trans,poly-cis-decaprenylcistransferase [Phycisphaerales bacterium]
MDGNGRWAQERGLARIEGHRVGASLVPRLVTASVDLGIEALTLYSFSLENWKRPAAEIEALMDLCVDYLRDQQAMMIDHGVRLRHIGRREGLPRRVREQLDRTMAATRSGTGLTLSLALNYGSRAELTDAVRALARDVRAGTVDPADIDEAMIESRLDTAGLPDPDLLIRTAGEMRLSNYLLWQISYAEIHVTDRCWPDFDVAALHEALRDFGRRTRKFGALPPLST